MLSAGLPGSRINRNLPRDVLYGPVSNGGIGMWNLYDYQGLSQISFLAEHLHEDNISGNLLRCSIEAASIEIGIGRNLFELNYDLYSHLLTDCWIKNIWKYSHEHNIVIKENTTIKPFLRRENDLFLMELFTDHGFTKTELQHINRCRLFVQAMTVSDIFDGYGNKYEKNSFNCIKDEYDVSPYIWPRQTAPCCFSIRLWKKAIKQCFPRDHNNNTLYTLGRWSYFSPNDNWVWFFYPRDNLLYKKSMGGWEIFTRRSRSGSLGEFPTFQYFNRAMSLPRNSYRAKVERINGNCVKINGWTSDSDNLFNPMQELLSNNISDIRKSLQSKRTSLPDSDRALSEAILNKEFIFVSDGSFIQSLQYGTARWIAEKKIILTIFTLPKVVLSHLALHTYNARIEAN